MKERSQSILVTGATGFLGAHLAAALHKAGHRVAALVRPDADLVRLRLLAGPVELEICQLEDRAALTATIARVAPETIFHLAGDTTARHFAGDWDVVDRAMSANVGNSLNVLRAAMQSGAPVRRIIRTGGLEEYGDGPKPATESQALAPTSPYSASQASVTAWFNALQHHTDIMLTTLRPALIYGPGQSASFLIPTLIGTLLRGERFAMSQGRQRRDLLYVDDMTRAFLLAGQRSDLGGETINICTGSAIEMRSVAQRIATLLGASDLLDIGALGARPMDLEEVSGTNAKAAALLGWAPQVSLEDGLALTIASGRQDTRTEARERCGEIHAR